MKKNPIIAVGPHFILSESKRQVIGSYQNYLDYIQSVGGQPLILTPGIKDKLKIARQCDGLLLQGGGDIHPKFFKDRIPKNIKLDLSPDARTFFDLEILRAFLKLNKPILGICLGAQTLNIILGGNIIQDIPSQCLHARNHRKGNHPTYILPHSKLARILKTKKIKTNSRHHQSILKLGRGLIISAQSDDGIIEAVESTRHRFVMGLQWHPEIEKKSVFSHRIFKAFIEAC